MFSVLSILLYIALVICSELCLSLSPWSELFPVGTFRRNFSGRNFFPSELFTVGTFYGRNFFRRNFFWSELFPSELFPVGTFSVGTFSGRNFFRSELFPPLIVYFLFYFLLSFFFNFDLARKSELTPDLLRFLSSFHLGMGFAGRPQVTMLWSLALTRLTALPFFLPHLTRTVRTRSCCQLPSPFFPGHQPGFF